MKKSLMLLAILFQISCSKDNQNGAYVSVDVDLSVRGSDGGDVTNIGDYRFDKMTVKYLVNGLQINPPSQGTQPLNISENSTHIKRFRFFLNHDEKEEYPITYIIWNNVDTDTIKAHFERKEGYLAYDKIWINGVLQTNWIKPEHYLILQK